MLHVIIAHSRITKGPRLCTGSAPSERDIGPSAAQVPTLPAVGPQQMPGPTDLESNAGSGLQQHE